MAKLTLTDLDSLSNETTAIANINNNSAAIETAIENTLSRDGTGPNQMGANLDMNGYRIQNLPKPVGNTEPLRLIDLGNLIPSQASLDAAVVLAEFYRDEAQSSAGEAALSAIDAQTAQAAAELAETNAEAAYTAIQNVVNSASPTIYNATGDGVTTVYNVGVTLTEENTHVYIDGVYQFKNTFSVAATNLTFSAAPPNGALIEVVAGANAVLSVTTIGGVTGLQAALDAKAPIANPTLTGTTSVTDLNVADDVVVIDAVSIGGTLTVDGISKFNEDILVPAGSAAGPSISFSADTNTGIWRSAADTLNISTAGVERFEIDATSADFTVNLYGDTGNVIWNVGTGTGAGNSRIRFQDTYTSVYSGTNRRLIVSSSGITVNTTNDLPPGSASMYVDGAGGVIISDDYNIPDSSLNSASRRGVMIRGDAQTLIATSGNTPLLINRMTNDGNLIGFFGQGNQEGVISVSGAVVTYGSFCGAHWSQLKDKSTPNIPRGTVVESIDELAEWDGETNEHLAKFKVSDTPGSRAVYGVFNSWDEDGDAMIASLGAFVVRVQWDEVLYVGDLLESAGNGTARKQKDDIVRSSTIAKVTSTKVIETYKDGSFLVPCTLHCG